MHMTLEDIDAELALLPATPVTDADLNARAALMSQRITLDQAAKATAEADRQPKPRGNLVIRVPAGAGTSHYFSERGRVAQSRVTDDGCVVIDLFPAEFRQLLMDKRFGRDWHDNNPEALRALGQA
jgi:hypothetical protein